MFEGVRNACENSAVFLRVTKVDVQLLVIILRNCFGIAVMSFLRTGELIA